MLFQFLTRGHLAPRADFALRSHQRASFHYINAAPQWMRGNAGDWAALEDVGSYEMYTPNDQFTLFIKNVQSKIKPYYYPVKPNFICV